MPKTYFVSDVHLGAPALSNNRERELLFVKWLEFAGQDAKTIYLLGDIFDFWYEYKKVAPRGFTRTLAKLAELTDKGIEIFFFTGNHDIWVDDYLPSETGVKVVRKHIETRIDGKTFFLGHGDGLDSHEKGYLFLKGVFTNKIAQFLYTWLLHPNIAYWIGHKWAKGSRLSNGLGVVESKDFDNETNVKFARLYSSQRHVDYFVLGHRHIFADKKIGNSRIIMLGEWINHFSYAVFDGKDLELKKFADSNLSVYEKQ